jgi:hypothetical protein
MEDAKLQILLQSSYPDIIHLCAVDKAYNKVCNNPLLWEQLIQRDFPYMPIVSPKQNYIKAYTIFNTYTILTIKNLLNTHVLYYDMQDLYNEVFDTLVMFIRACFYNIETIEDYTFHWNTVENETFTILRGIFKIKSIEWDSRLLLENFYREYNKQFFKGNYQPPYGKYL